MVIDQYCIRPSAMLGLGQWVELCNLTMLGVQVLSKNVHIFSRSLSLSCTCHAMHLPLVILSRRSSVLDSVTNLNSCLSFAQLVKENLKTKALDECLFILPSTYTRTISGHFDTVSEDITSPRRLMLIINHLQGELVLKMRHGIQLMLSCKPEKG